jgi:hypothetical protein
VYIYVSVYTKFRQTKLPYSNLLYFTVSCTKHVMLEEERAMMRS